jgi:16S rRNA (cytidine1402-2'-O)-methyltransferase
LQTLQHNTRLATASGLTLTQATCHSGTVKIWKQKAWSVENNQPTVFAIGR